MRLGYFSVGSAAQAREVVDGLDQYGLSAVWASGLETLTDDECLALREETGRLGFVLGEAAAWGNLMTDDEDKRAERIDNARTLLHKAELAGCRCMVTLVGTKDASDHPLAPHPYMYTDAARDEFREICLRILDGFDLKTVRYGIEPWHNTFFYQPEDIREFLDRVGHPALGLHLDQMNMVDQHHFYDTTSLINTTFDLLAEEVCSVHLKDLRCDHTHMFLKWDEVRIGEGVMDYDTFLRRLAELPADTPCFCEHFSDEGDYAICFARLHHLAAKAGVRFLRRGEKPATG